MPKRDKRPKRATKKPAGPKRWSGTELAKELGVDRRTVTNWLNMDQPCPSHGTGADRYFLLAEVDGWRRDIARREAEAARPAPGDIDEAKLRKLAAEAEEAELRVAKLRGELLPLDLHEARVRDLSDRLAARVKTLGRYRGDVQLARSDIDAIQLLERIQDELLRSLQETADDEDDEPSDDQAAA